MNKAALIPAWQSLLFFCPFFGFLLCWNAMIPAETNFI
ncbi:hypothetical protein D1AOALGA4SA_7330 [Olavius algarvensis Delta 1 endosymbiont]|nr:hypothetical protein D1AOALGA4SA_7330 [Olavius algarvensis Delta 1 endosymbiont]